MSTVAGLCKLLLFALGLASGLLLSYLVGIRPGQAGHRGPPDRPDNVLFEDAHLHKDDTITASDLRKKVRVLCWIMTSPENLNTRAIHVRETWGKRCDITLFASDKEDPDFPTINITVKHGRHHLTAKAVQAFDYVYKNHLDDADWFMKADDDTYVIVENLRYLLSAHDPNEPVYFGQHFRAEVGQGFTSGGSGYVLSKEALVRFGKRRDKLCAEDKGAEDMEIGKCMENLGVKIGDSRDALGRSRFHCFTPEGHLHGNYPAWYHDLDKHGAKMGISNMSDYAITFHYVSPEQMYNLEYYSYHMRPYGIIAGKQNLN